jgi:hypothetical protein
MTWGGPFEPRGNAAAGAALKAGATPLEALIVGDAASYGEVCFVKDAVQAATIVQRNGRHPHSRSVARARRHARDKGLLDYRRIMPGHRPPGAKYAGPGTTAKFVDFKAFKVKDPMSRADRRRQHRRRMAVEAYVERKAKPVSPEVRQPADRPRHSSPVPEPVAHTTRASIDPELSAVINELGAKLQAKWDAEQCREDERMVSSIPRRPKPPD